MEINIAINAHDGYVNLPLVCINSAIETKKPDVKYVYYIMYDEMNDENKKAFTRFQIENHNVEINYVYCKDLFTEYIPSDRWPVNSLYRLALGERLPKLDKIIYMDGDVLVNGDLSEMYKIDIGDDKLFLGHLNTYGTKHVVETIYNTSLKTYICSGVMLMNLKKMRELHVQGLIENYILTHNKTIFNADEAVINYLFNDYIGVLSPQFGTFWYVGNSETSIREMYIRNDKSRSMYPLEEFLEGYKKQVVTHLVPRNGRKCFFYPYGLFDVYGMRWLNIALKNNILHRVIGKFYIKDYEQNFYIKHDHSLLVLSKDEKSIFEAYEDGSIKCLDCGKYLCGMEFEDTPKDTWYIYPNDDGSYTFGLKSNIDLCMDIKGGMFIENNNLQMWVTNGTKSQKFIIQSLITIL